MRNRLIIFTALSLILFLLFQGCNGLETDISKKLDYPFYINSSSLDMITTDSVINIPAHDEIDDYVDYAVYPDPFRINEVSYEISDVGLDNTAQEVDISGFYRNASLDTIPLFQVTNVPLVQSKQTVLAVNSNDLSTITNLVNNQTIFDMIIEVSGDTQMIDFHLNICFDTTITIDYDL